MSNEKMKGDEIPQGAFDVAPAVINKTSRWKRLVVPAVINKTSRWKRLVVPAIIAIIAILAVADGQVQRHRLRAAEARIEQVGAIVAPTWRPWRAFGRVGKVREALK